MPGGSDDRGGVGREGGGSDTADMWSVVESGGRAELRTTNRLDSRRTQSVSE